MEKGAGSPAGGSAPPLSAAQLRASQQLLARFTQELAQLTGREPATAYQQHRQLELLSHPPPRSHALVPGHQLWTPGLVSKLGVDLALAQDVNGQQVGGSAFEGLLARSAQRDGRTVLVPETRNHAGFDLLIDTERLSLKSEYSSALRADHARLTKLMDGGWIKHARAEGRDLRVEARRRLVAHLQQYEHIVSLRSVAEPGVVRYQLIQVPHRLLLAVQDSRRVEWGEQRASGQLSARVKVRGRHAFTLTVDGSDGKMQINRIDLAHCQALAYWEIPLNRPLPLDEA